MYALFFFNVICKNISLTASRMNFMINLTTHFISIFLEGTPVLNPNVNKINKFKYSILLKFLTKNISIVLCLF